MGVSRPLAGCKIEPYFFPPAQDRKSTRLNSSHLGISYAVSCLKKKTRLARRYRCCYSGDRTIAPASASRKGADDRPLLIVARFTDSPAATHPSAALVITSRSTP